jgi:hypothetical protein
MATNQPEMFSSAAGVGSGLRVWPLTIQPKLFATGSGTLAKLTPVAFDTTAKQWKPWDQTGGAAGQDTIRGVVWPDAITLNGSDEVIGQVMLEGKVHFDDLPAATDVDASATAAGWNQALRDAQSWGLIVEGIPSAV